MTEEIYIDDVPMELDSNVNISLSFKSNIFSDISKITSNNSYTIKLPKTYNNRKAFGFADMPSNASDVFRKTRRARCLRNGIELIKEAEAHLLGCNGKIEIALTWGYPERFSEWLKKGEKLQDLSLFSNEAIQWGNGMFKDFNTYAPYFFSQMITSKNGNLYDAPYYSRTHPVVSVYAVISWISETVGVNFLFSELVVSKMKKLIIPLITANASLINERESDSRFTIIGSPDGKILSYIAGAMNLQYVILRYMRIATISHTIGFVMRGKVTYSLKIQTNAPIVFTMRNEKTGEDKIIHKPKYNLATGSYPYQYNETSFFDASPNADEMIIIKCETAVSLRFDLSQGPNNRVWFRIMPKQLTAHSVNGAINGAYSFPIVPNLPDITQVDFIKAICAMLGLYIVTDGGVLRFIEVDVLYRNKLSAIDWSNRIDGYLGCPDETKFALNGFGQRNRFDYKEDADVAVRSDGAIDIDNKSIEVEKSIITLPFSATDDHVFEGVTFAKFDLYVREAEDDTATGGASTEKTSFDLKKVSPRILQEVNVGGKSAAVFHPLKFQTLLNENYASYKKIIGNQRVITVNVRLSDIDLQKIDFSIPIYIEQYGGYFAIVEIKTGKGSAKVELIKM